MTIAPLLTIAGVAAGGLATLAAQSVDSGLSFLAELNKPESKPEAAPVSHDVTSLPPINFLEAAQAALSKFHQQLGPKLAALGIDTSIPMTFTVDSLGAVRETSGHPQAQQIEQMLATDDPLARLFRDAQCHFEVCRAAEEHQRFAKVYAQNPDLAVQQFSHLFDGSDPPKFHARVTSDKVEVEWRQAE